MEPMTLYFPDPPPIPLPFQSLLSTYSSIPASQQTAHITTLRAAAYNQHPYPCLGRWRFLDLDMSSHPIYASILDLFKRTATDDHGPVFLDLGCCIAQDIRKFLLDVSPTLPPPSSLVNRVFGAELLEAFVEIGYELFRDETGFPRTQFITPANVFDESAGNALSRLDGQVDVLHTGAFFHLFDLDGMKGVARRCLRLLHREAFGSGSRMGGGEGVDLGGEWNKKALLFGEQVGNVNAGEYQRGDGRARYRHNAESWRVMWEEVVAEVDWVKGVVVESRLVVRGVGNRKGDGKGDAEIDKEVQEGEEKQNEKERFMGRVEEGFRWHVWWVWVEFA